MSSYAVVAIYVLLVIFAPCLSQNQKTVGCSFTLTFQKTIDRLLMSYLKSIKRLPILNLKYVPLFVPGTARMILQKT